MKHEVTAKEIWKLGSFAPIGWRWSCSCGRSSDGRHDTMKKAILAGHDHIPSGPKSYTIIVSPADDGEIWTAVKEAADKIAGVFDTLSIPYWDVDVIEGTFSDPLSGDNVHGLGRKAQD